MIVDGLCKNGMVEEAEELASNIENNNLKRDEVTYNLLISGYSMKGNSEKCLELYKKMKASEIKPTINTYHPVSQMNLNLDRLLYNELIQFYTDLGFVAKTCSLYHEMIDNGVLPDRMAYNSLIRAYLKERKIHESKDIVDQMKASGLVPKADTYDTKIKGLCDIKMFSEGYIWYREMVANIFFSSVNDARELLSGLKEGGKLQEVQVMSSEMNVEGLDYFSAKKKKQNPFN
ncbi:putative tetratricopeptide-like helical domain superfamily [Helianthus annuus]|nr:putative tetratricopeptide-like helical domain superfamily [Helianthus annuus]